VTPKAEEPPKAGMGMALDWKKAAKLAPRNGNKGARPKNLDSGS
jgi:hypothetical protein